jgi:hypothetical protein
LLGRVGDGSVEGVHGVDGEVVVAAVAEAAQLAGEHEGVATGGAPVPLCCSIIAERWRLRASLLVSVGGNTSGCVFPAAVVMSDVVTAPGDVCALTLPRGLREGRLVRVARFGEGTRGWVSPVMVVRAICTAELIAQGGGLAAAGVWFVAG